MYVNIVFRSSQRYAILQFTCIRSSIVAACLLDKQSGLFGIASFVATAIQVDQLAVKQP